MGQLISMKICYISKTQINLNFNILGLQLQYVVFIRVPTLVHCIHNNIIIQAWTVSINLKHKISICLGYKMMVLLHVCQLCQVLVSRVVQSLFVPCLGGELSFRSEIWKPFGPSTTGKLSLNQEKSLIYLQLTKLKLKSIKKHLQGLN